MPAVGAPRLPAALLALALLVGCGRGNAPAPIVNNGPGRASGPAPAPNNGPDASSQATKSRQPATDNPQPATEPPPPPPPPPPPQPPPKASAETVQKVKGLMRRLDSEVSEECDAAWKELKDMGDLATPALIEAVKGGEAAERRNAVRALGLLKDRLAAETLRAALADQDPDVRWQSARALGEIGDAGSREALARALREDRDETVREHAAYALAALGADQGFAFFKEELKAESTTRRSRAVLALGKYGKGKFIPELAAALKDREPRVRMAAVNQLGDTRQKQVIPALIAALGDDDYKIRERARSALERLTWQQEPGSSQAKWEEWWQQNAEKFRLSASGGPEPHQWVNAPGLKGEADFKKHVGDAKGLVAVYFQVARNRACMLMAPTVDRLAAEYKAKLAFCEAEARENASVIRRLNLRTAPSTVVFRDGKRLETIAGVKTEAELRKILDEHLAGTRQVAPEPEPEPGPEKAGEPNNLEDLKTEEEFQARVAKGQGLAVVVFGANDHPDGARQVMELTVLALACPGVKFFGAEFAPGAELAGELGLKPGALGVVIFRDGAKVEAVGGFIGQAELRAKLDKYLDGKGGGE